MKIENLFLDKIKAFFSTSSVDNLAKDELPDNLFNMVEEDENSFLRDFKTKGEWLNHEVKDERFLGFLWKTGNKTLQTADGTRITIEGISSDNLVARENFKTGEVVLLGEDGLNIQLLPPKDLEEDTPFNGAAEDKLHNIMNKINHNLVNDFEKTPAYDKLKDYLLTADDESYGALLNLFESDAFVSLLLGDYGKSDLDRFFDLKTEEKYKLKYLIDNELIKETLRKDSLGMLCDIAELDNDDFSKAMKNFNNSYVIRAVKNTQEVLYENIIPFIENAKNLESLSYFQVLQLVECLGQYNSLNSSVGENFDDFNKALYGPPIDPTLTSRVEELGAKYDIDIKITNNVALDKNNKEAEVYIDEEYFKSLDEMLGKMKKSGMQIPEEIYICDLNGSINLGTFYQTNSNAITLNADNFTNDDMGVVLAHETGHLKDYDGGLISKSTYKAYELGIVKELKNLYDEPIEEINFKGNKITREEIAGLISDYSTSDIVEYVAEIEALIANGTIIKDSDGKYIIDSDNIPKNYCEKWTGSEKDHESLNKIMKFFNYLTY